MTTQTAPAPQLANGRSIDELAAERDATLIGVKAVRAEHDAADKQHPAIRPAA